MWRRMVLKQMKTAGFNIWNEAAELAKVGESWTQRTEICCACCYVPQGSQQPKYVNVTTNLTKHLVEVEKLKSVTGTLACDRQHFGGYCSGLNKKIFMCRL